MFIKINPEKLIQKRGTRSRRQIVELSGGKISEMNLSHWEAGSWQPSLEKLKVLLKALDATVEEIADPVELSLA